MTPRLLSESSRYLRQHAHNPVDWYPWGSEAFEKAKLENRPVFLSVGYSSCHWCHVMEHESFENESIAEILNRSFVSIKVDREERPDIDDAYLTFVQMVSGRGGWPMSAFLRPDKSPFFGGTYFPREDRGQHSGFRSILLSIEDLWVNKRAEVDEAAEYYATGLREAATEHLPSENGAAPDLGKLIKSLTEAFDSQQGGFSSAPKFPPHAALELLLTLNSVDPMALKTLLGLGRGGIHDHVGGGFHRYSTDGEWHLPHFEKMLYDNALLLKAYSMATKGATGDTEALLRDCAEGIISWLNTEMRSQEGLYFSALDADSEGEEGKFYVWKHRELVDLPEGAAFAEAYRSRPAGNFHDEATGLLTGENVLHLAENSLPFKAQLKLLRNRREERIRPQLDDKALISWNGLTISALVAAERIDLATRCADAILAVEREAGHLPRYVYNCKPTGEAFLEDYAYLALGLFDLGTKIEAYAVHGVRLGHLMIERFYDADKGGFFSSRQGGEELFGRTKPVFDQPIPSSNAVAIRVLIRMGDIARAEQSLMSLQGWMNRAPMACEALFLAQWELNSFSGATAGG